IKKETEAILDEVIGIRRHLHQFPELSFQEFNTSNFVAEKLSEWDIEHKTGIVNTGIVGIIYAEKSTQKCIGLRADLDALPIQEANETPYRSKNEGIMHACGHDVHTAILLGTAKI